MRSLATVALLLALAVTCLVFVGCKQPATNAGDSTPVASSPLPAPEGTTGAADKASAEEIKVYVPCGMIVPVKAVMSAYEAQNPGTKVTGVFDNGGIIVERLTKKGEKADVVMTAGRVEMKALQDAGLVSADAVQALGEFELVVIVPKASKLGLKTPADLKKCKTIASPDPDVNSTGASGKEALTSLGLWDELKPKMVFTKHAIEAYTMVASGKADAALAYRNCPLETNPEKLSKSKVGLAFDIPEDAYKKQQCLVAPVQGGRTEAAGKFVAFMVSDEGRKLLSDNGLSGALDLNKPAGTK
ncbi:MAG: molybdate ABC transporter substrate-binding protein [Armatimonadetes bacterium]|nr:molybdate ABC transporter substrate-binding protein [Armatimonadota bacterium]